MASKLLIFVSFLSVIVFAKAEEDWSCERLNGVRCSGVNMMVSGVGRQDPYINVSVDATCTDRQKQKSNSFTATRSTLYNENVTATAECLDTSTPCITEFSLCVTDFNVSPVTLKCTYLRDFVTANNATSSGSQSPKCGTRAMKQNTYLMTTSRGTTTIKYNCRKIYVSKPLTDDDTRRK